ncbi:polyprenyl synthetase family protein [Rhodopila sp.]|uniref:polyprenyl synthetase family protein n=1 Tax=Rhodopila sp. TaxID=2480087 RepID=UPI002B6C778E|nr:polyprenyl synthetase family protein [Rhodopila sp.]HVZ06303.1 polyprenyl synthetase family protein [Rhodopila sp.]
MPDIPTPNVVRETLEEYGALTREAMAAYFPTAEPRHHLYDMLSDYPKRGGKMMRSSLCIATARAFGAEARDALHSAVAIELLHNALLIHDDIEDESEQRRDRPTLHALHGIPLALNAGDALTLLSIRPLFENFDRVGPRVALSIVRETERMAWESAEGQAMELGWRRDNRNGLSDADYLVMVLKKTCWLASIHPSRIGAMIATRGNLDLDPFIRFGFFLGAAFQIQDDVLNLVPDDTYGKEPNGDIFEAKRTLMLNHVYRLSPPAQQRELASLLDPGRRERTADQVAWIRQLMDGYGSIEYARGIAHGLAGAALHEYATIYRGLPDTRDTRFIRGLATWIFHRM